jgi:hypothetical protein
MQRVSRALGGGAGENVSGTVDLDKAIGKKTYAFVKKRSDSENGAGELSL